MMSNKESLEPETIAAIEGAGDCGPLADEVWGDGRWYICDYHEGYDAAVSEMKCRRDFKAVS